MSGVAPAAGEFYLVAQDLLDCNATALGSTAAGAPERRCIYTGSELAWDACDCGTLSVHVPRTYLSETFPDIKLRPPFKGDCQIPFTVVEYVITILRCVPGMGPNAAPPACSELNLAAATDLDDRQAVLFGTRCCLAARMHMIGEQLAVGEQGQCAGSELHVFVPFSNCVACPDGVF